MDQLPPAFRLDALRASLKKQNLDGFIIKRGDEYLNEYVAPYAERLAWLSGFTGSAGMAIVLEHKAAVFSDGRYLLQMNQQLDKHLWEYHHITHRPPEKWLHSVQPSSVRIGYDPKLMSEKDIEPFLKEGLTLIPLGHNPIDKLWINQPEPPTNPIVAHLLEWSGLSSQDKIAYLTQEMLQKEEDAILICDPASICWLLNIRGSDIPYTPIPLTFAILHQNKKVVLYTSKGRNDNEIMAYLEPTAIVRNQNALEEDLITLSNKKIALDSVQTPIWFIQVLEKAKAQISRRPNPCLLLKACKNETEQAGARQAHIRDGVALCRFLYWLEQEGIGKDEIQLAQQLNHFRQEIGGKYYREESFPAISAIGKNAAIIHYQATQEHKTILKEENLYLIDSGGQYVDGTTDVTRTIWIGKSPPSALLKEAVTCVLKGHIALASTRFPEEISGSRLDSLARRPLWEKGLDFDHGTGHGVGSFLSVHEGPCSISFRSNSVPLKKGMILSNEPGYYRENAFGIRLENLLLITPSSIENFLCFETLTLVPFDYKLINPDLLNPQEKEWLNQYHLLVLEKISPYLSSEERIWLEQACSPITKLFLLQS